MFWVPTVVSTTRTENSSVPSPALPLKLMAAALVELMLNRSSAPLPVVATLKAVPALTSSDLLPRFNT